MGRRQHPFVWYLLLSNGSTNIIGKAPCERPDLAKDQTLRKTVQKHYPEDYPDKNTIRKMLIRKKAAQSVCYLKH